MQIIKCSAISNESTQHTNGPTHVYAQIQPFHVNTHKSEPTTIVGRPFRLSVLLAK